MRRFVPLNLDAGLLILRIVIAAVLLYHGVPKLLDFGGTASGFASMNIPAPTLSAAFALISEVVGGVLLLLGIATDLAGLLVVIDMLGAIATVHWSAGFDFTKGGWEHPFTVLGIALALMLTGPGGYSVGARRVVP
ncbi:MAG: DoxX family protein [Gemmatimonadales bacterium]